METQSKALTTQPGIGAAIEQVLIGGDLKALTPEQRVSYYNKTCESLGLNPLTRPFDYLTLNNKLILYARKDCTEQLRGIHKVSITIVAREVVEGCYVVTAKASNPDGRTDESIGAVPIDKTAGEARANAMMKAETKAKRRVTLSFCGLGMLDETEVDSIPGATQVADAEVVPPEQKTPAPETTGQQKTAQSKAAAVIDPIAEQKKAMDALVTLLGTKGVTGGKAILAWFTQQTRRDIKKLSDLTFEEYQTAKAVAEKLPEKTTQGKAA